MDQSSRRYSVVHRFLETGTEERLAWSVFVAAVSVSGLLVLLHNDTMY